MMAKKRGRKRVVLDQSFQTDRLQEVHSCTVQLTTSELASCNGKKKNTYEVRVETEKLIPVSTVY